MFSATDDAEAINPFQKNAIFLSLFEGRQRLKYLRMPAGVQIADNDVRSLQGRVLHNRAVGF